MRKGTYGLSVLAATLGTIMAIALPTAADATSVIDVDNLVTGTPTSGWPAGKQSNHYATVYQSFTATLTGQFTYLDLFSSMNGPGYAYVKLYLGDGEPNTPPLPLLGTVTETGPFATAVNRFDFSSFDIDMTAGQVYTFSLDAAPLPSGDCPMFTCSLFTGYTTFADGETSNNYAGGEVSALVSREPDVFLTGDLSFRTFVDTGSAVPEPATWAMMICGMGMIGTMTRRRRFKARPLAPAMM